MRKYFKRSKTNSRPSMPPMPWGKDMPKIMEADPETPFSVILKSIKPVKNIVPPANLARTLNGHKSYWESLLGLNCLFQTFLEIRLFL